MSSSALQDRRVIESLLEGLVVHDANGAIIDFNQRALEVLGLSAEQLLGRVETDPNWRLMRPDATALPEAEIPSVEARRTRRPVLRRRLSVMRPGGEFRSLLVSAVPIHDTQGQVERVVAVFLDITEDLARDRELQETRRFLELSNDVLAVVSASESVILHLNEGAAAVFGAPSTALVGRPIIELIHPEDAQGLGLAGRTAPLRDTALRIRRADGTWRWLAVNAALQESPLWGRVWLVRGVDVTDLRRQAEELSRSRQQLAEAQEIAHLSTWEADEKRRTFTLSTRLRGLLGLAGEQEPVSLEALVACFTVEERARVKEALERALTGQAVTLQTRARGADGDVRELRLWTRERPRGCDAPLFGVVQDISEQVRLNAKLQLTERMASIGTLAAGVAHEINNPLAYVLSNLTMALSELEHRRALLGPDAEELISALVEAKDGAERVKQIVSDLRTFARVDEPRRVPCDVAQVVSAALNMARNETRHRARVVTHFEPTGPVLANEARLGQVFLNLIVNAAQAIPDGKADQNSITVTVRERGAWIHVSVKDTGSGIAPEHLPRIFDPFFSTKAVGEGTGLGLFIAQNIVRDLGGELSVDSTPGLGSTFDVRLPAAVIPWQASAPTPAPVTRGANLLVVDDEPLLLKALGRMLGRGHTLTLVGSGREALELLEAGKRYDAVLCDMMMPDVSGLDVWERLGELDERQQRRFIFMTGGTFTERARRFLEAQRPPMLEKPFTASAFANLLAQLIAQSE
jgi:PAS domain S-box-containing protein